MTVREPVGRTARKVFACMSSPWLLRSHCRAFRGRRRDANYQPFAERNGAWLQRVVGVDYSCCPITQQGPPAAAGGSHRATEALNPRPAGSHGPLLADPEAVIRLIAGCVIV
jgi:hypothetical protein